jgi:hypothetical protein
MNLQYTFSSRAKMFTYILIAIGVITMVAGFIMDKAPEGVNAEDYHHTRFWANFLVDSFFFMAVGLGATFFIAMNYASEAAWFVALKRIFEAVSTYLGIGAIFMIIALAAGSFGAHHLYHWMVEGISDPSSHHYDPVIAGKSAYLNQAFFWIRTLLYLGVWVYFQRVFRKRSLADDLSGTVPSHLKTMRLAAVFLVFFAVTSTTSAWDWIMSIDTHWFSTLFGWYVFSGMWISSIIMIIMITLHLKKKGHLEFVNESHMHDMGKWMFAVSFLWSYLWFAQFMLIWYSNIPEEITYFKQRIDHHRVLYFTMFFINFALPMLFLMSRDAKRNRNFLLVVGFVIFFTHWIDALMLVMPGTVGVHLTIGWMEIGMFLGFLGGFMFTVLTSLTKAPLLVRSHPYLDESLHHHV